MPSTTSGGVAQHPVGTSGSNISNNSTVPNTGKGRPPRGRLPSYMGHNGHYTPAGYNNGPGWRSYQYSPVWRHHQLRGEISHYRPYNRPNGGNNIWGPDGLYRPHWGSHNGNRYTPLSDNNQDPYKGNAITRHPLHTPRGDYGWVFGDGDYNNSPRNTNKLEQPHFFPRAIKLKKGGTKQERVQRERKLRAKEKKTVSNQCIFNLSKQVLSRKEQEVLNRGLKYWPPKKVKNVTPLSIYKNISEKSISNNIWYLTLLVLVMYVQVILAQIQLIWIIMFTLNYLMFPSLTLLGL